MKYPLLDGGNFLLITILQIHEQIYAKSFGMDKVASYHIIPTFIRSQQWWRSMSNINILTKFMFLRPAITIQDLAIICCLAQHYIKKREIIKNNSKVGEIKCKAHDGVIPKIKGLG